MGFLKSYKYPIAKQYLISALLILITTVIAYFSVDFIGYHAVALLFLLTVSFLAMIFDIFPVLLSALISALIWNFFFIAPTFTFHIGTAEDVLMFLMYFVIALINAVLTYKIRQVESKIRDEKEKEKTIKLYNTLLNSLSHELRTPIATIIGAIDTIKDNGTKLTESNISDLYTEIEIAGFRLNRQVENLLSMSRLEAGILKPKLDWCDVNELVFSVIKNCKEDVQDRSLVFEPNEQLPLFKIDNVLVEQILYNILHNALQHTPNNATVQIQVHDLNNICQFIIADNGNGFPEAEINLVFDKFYRLTNTSTGGTGLGLSIAKGFTEALGGQIRLENQKTGGSKFTVEIPAQTSSINELENE